MLPLTANGSWCRYPQSEVRKIERETEREEGWGLGGELEDCKGMENIRTFPTKSNKQVIMGSQSLKEKHTVCMNLKEVF